VDRVGALRARQIAVALVRDIGVREATVFLSYLPGEEKPDFVSARVDGEWWDADRIQRAIQLPDLSIEGSFRNLELGEVRWVPFAQDGYFGAVGQWG
jgi:S-adenosylmethionine synthetase